MTRSRWQGRALGLLMAIAPITAPAAWANTPAAPESTGSARSEMTLQTQIAPPQITLLEAGQGDRQSLRLRLQQGDQQRSLLVMRSQMQLTLAGQQPMPMPVPEMRLLTEITINQAASDGQVSYTLRYPKIEMIAPPEMSFVQPAMDSTARELERIQIQVEGDDRGKLSKVNVLADGELSAPLQASLGQMTESIRNSNIEFPAEPIGVGGRWQSVTEIESGGLRIQQRAVYQVVEITPDRVVLNVTAEQTAPPQKLTIPGLAPEQAPSLRSYQANGSGQIQMNFNRVVPTQSNLSLKVRSEMEGLPGVGTALMTGNLEMTLEPQP